MIDIDRRIKAMRAELAAAEQMATMYGSGPIADASDAAVAAQQRLEAAKIRLALLCDLQDIAVGRFPSSPGTDDPLADYCEVRPDFERSMVVVVTERLEQGDHSWEVSVRTPDGRYLAGDLSDDMPQTPGEAVQSAGRMLDVELVTERWDDLWKPAPEPETGRVMIKNRLGMVPDLEATKRIKARLSSADTHRLERATKAWWDYESKALVVEEGSWDDGTR